jgi:hypothetical protein
MLCRKHCGLGAVDLVEALSPGKIQTPRNLGYTGRRFFHQSALQGEADIVSTTPQLNTPIIAERSDVKTGRRRIAKQLRHRHSDLVTHPQKSADLWAMGARYPVSQRATRRPREIGERQQVAGRGGSNACGQVGAEVFPQWKPLQFWRRSEQIADRFRYPNLTFQIRFAH